LAGQGLYVCHHFVTQIDIFDSKDLDNNITHNSTIIAHVINVPEEKENIFEFPNLKGMHFIHVNARSILPKMSELVVVLSKATPHHPFVNQFLY
jgi:hypothetical protein